VLDDGHAADWVGGHGGQLAEGAILQHSTRLVISVGRASWLTITTAW
jgi:hypothetical protein